MFWQQKRIDALFTQGTAQVVAEVTEDTVGAVKGAFYSLLFVSGKKGLNLREIAAVAQVVAQGMAEGDDLIDHALLQRGVLGMRFVAIDQGEDLTGQVAGDDD